MSRISNETVRHGEMLAAIKALVDLHDLGLVQPTHQPTTKGGQLVAQTVQKARVMLAATNRYRERGRRDG